MSKINQIQNAIKELEGGAFQKLADSYLLRKGYPQINPIGSVPGSNKTKKGTPDTYTPLDDGGYVFAEYTTSKDRVCRKFSDDITKCLDEEKTGIAIAKIKEIVLCCTSDLSLKDFEKLQKQCAASKVNLKLFGLGTISCDLLEKYPSIAKDHLGIEVDTGQIVSLESFIPLYESHKLATALRTKFHFRMDKINELLSLIQGNDLVIISGQAGVGKSRIAVECYRRFIKENKSYKDYCIFNQGVDLFEDIKSYFSDSGNFLIFVDDANRISSFQYIVQLLQTKRNDQNFKILVTVRDYALEKIREDCQSIDGGAEITIDPLTDEEIRTFLQDEFGIKDHLYLDRIANIAQGNPRLAIMAAQVAKKNNTFESIGDVTQLYDQYYSSITLDLEALGDEEILKVAGIVAFFRSIDRTNDDFMLDIERIFGISAEDFWEALKKLHDMEVLDMFEDEVVKVSDQVLSTYIFYLVFFKEKLIDFPILINNLFPRYKQRFIDALNPILSSFNSDEIKKVMVLAVDNVWDEMQEKNESDFLQFIDVFYFLKPTEALGYIKGKIDSVDSQDIVFDNIKFEATSNSSLPKLLSTLSLFRYLGEDMAKISLELFLQYAEKQPRATPEILHYLANSYGFQSDSYRYNYYIQHAVVDKLLEQSRSGSNEYFTRLLIALAENYLHTNFSSTKAGRGRTINIISFGLADNSEALPKLREKILKQLFSLYKDEKYQKHILKLLLSHAQSGLDVSVSGIVEDDSKLILPFFNSAFDPSNICHCIVVHQYLRLLNRLKIQTKKALNMRFQSPGYMLYDLLTNKLEMIELGHDAYEEYKKKEIERLTLSYSKEDYDNIFHQLHQVLQTFGEDSQWQINQGVLSILEGLSKRDADLSHKVLSHYLEQGDYLEIDPWIVSSMLLRYEASRVFDIINTPKYPSKDRWLFSYFQHITSDDIKREHIKELSKLFKESEHRYFINDMDYLLKFEEVQKGFVADIVQIIIERANTAPKFAHLLSPMFAPYTKIYKNLNSVFSGKRPLLEDAYMAIDKVDQHADYDGTAFAALLDNNQTFIDRYLEDKYSQKERPSRRDGRDYSFIWLRDDYDIIMQSITSIIYEREGEELFFDYYELFFNEGSHPQTDNSILEKQDAYLIKEIETRFNEKEYMRFLFFVIVSFSLERKLIFYKVFLGKNKKIDDFNNLPYEPVISTYHGSAVPMLEDEIKFYEEIIQLCDSVGLLEHRQFMEQEIQINRKRIQHEKRRDFTEAHWA